MTMKLAVLLLSVSLAGVQALPARAADYIGDAAMPGACADPGILGFITERFDYRAENYLKADIAISDIRGVEQGRFIPRDETHRVEREYCVATAVTSDGEERSLWYLIERNWGFAGIGKSVEFCLSGLDPWYVYGAHCRSLR